MKLDNLSQKYSKAHIDSLISFNNNTLIYISTKWCAPCREMNPIVESLKDEFSDHLKKYLICGFNISCVGDDRGYSYDWRLTR